jgi:hypothetical protein
VNGPPDDTPVAGPSDDTPVDGPPNAALVDSSPNTVPTAGALDAAANGPPGAASAVGLPDDYFVDALPDTAPVDNYPYILFDERNEWTFPPWTLSLDSFFTYITPEEDERAEALLRQLLDKTRRKPWRIETRFIAKAAAGRLRGKPGKLAQGSGTMGINRGKLVKFKYLL